MTQASAPALARWAIRAEIRELYDDYAFALDAVDLDKWATFFTDDCYYRIVSRENYEENLPLSAAACRGIAMVRDRIAGLRETSVFEPRALRHLVGGVKVTEAPDGGWHGQANFAIFESMLERESHLLLVGHYLDHIVRDGDELKFRERICVYDNYRILTSLVYPV